MNWLSDLPIRRTLNRVILLTCTLVLFLACAVLAAYELFDFRRTMARDMSVLADVLAKNTRAALTFDDETSAEETLSALQAEPDVIAACIFAADGRAFAVYTASGSGGVLPTGPGADGSRFENGHLILARPVNLNEERIGTIYLEAGLQGIYQRLLLFAAIAFAVLLGSLAVAFLLSSRLQRPISQPILSLARSARSIAESKGYDVHAAPTGINEIGVLTDAFHQMLQGIEERETALRTSNESLISEVGERARAEALAKQSEERYRVLFDTLIEGFCTIQVIFDDGGKAVDYRFLEINPAFEKQTGLKDAEGKLMRDLAPDHEERWFEIYGKIALTGESAHFENEASALGRHYDVFAYRIGNPESRKVAILFNDITERKRAESRVQSELARLELLNQITRAIGERQDLPSIFQVVIGTMEEHLPADFACACLHDPREDVFRVTSLGPGSVALAAQLGLSLNAPIPIAENGLSRSFSGQLVYEPDIGSSEFMFPKALSRGGMRALVLVPLLVDKRIFGVLVAARRSPGSFSSGECEFLRQLSDHAALAAHQAQLHGALEQAYNELRETQQSVMQQERLRALGQMASGIAHDINNAISPVALYTESLLETEPNLSQRARNYLGTIQNAIEDVAETVSRMREFYRQREPERQLGPVSLNRLVEQVVELSRARWSDMPQQRGIVIDLATDLLPDLPSVMGIESEIREALVNLVFNAVDAMPEGGILTLRTRLLADQVGAAGHGRVVVEVADTGVGMDEDTRRRCLEPFFTTKGERGTGLGLAMVYGIVQRHGAELTFQSDMGRGTTVGISFGVPILPAIGSLEEPATFFLPPSLRILVVDDDPLLIKSLRDALETDGHTVVTANGGQAGIDGFRASLTSSERFSVVITDLGMPYVDGRKVSEAIKTASPTTPVILLTGWGQRLVAEGDVPPHVDRVLNKPPRLHELRAALAALAAPGPARAHA